MMEFIAENVERDGFGVIENLFTPEECDEMIAEIRKISNGISEISKKVFFRASQDDGGPQFKEKYFMESAHKISYFFEEKSVGPDGQLKVDSDYLALNKIGHALHVLSPVFKKYTFDERIETICNNLRLSNPAVCQSMFIFKNPEIGGEVPPHQDASYLHTDPQTLYGIWIPLEDANAENGCLWFHRGSHKGKLYKRYIRNPDEKSDVYTIYTGEDPEYDYNDFVAVPVKRGSCIVIHGKVLHFSKPNKSKHSRNVYTFHVFDKNSTFSGENWIQPSEETPFACFNEN